MRSRSHLRRRFIVLVAALAAGCGPPPAIPEGVSFRWESALLRLIDSAHAELELPARLNNRSSRNLRYSLQCLPPEGALLITRKPATGTVAPGQGRTLRTLLTVSLPQEKNGLAVYVLPIRRVLAGVLQEEQIRLHVLSLSERDNSPASPPAIDGDLGDPAWRDAVPLGTLSTGGAEATCRVLALHGGLYLGFSLYPALSAERRVFIDLLLPGGETRSFAYGGPDVLPPGSWLAHEQKMGNRWSLEIALPARDLPFDAATGLALRLELVPEEGSLSDRKVCFRWGDQTIQPPLFLFLR